MSKKSQQPRKPKTSKEPEKRIYGGTVFPGFKLLGIFDPLEMFGVLAKHLDIVMLGEDRAIEAAEQPEYEWHQDPAWGPFARPAGLA